MKQQAPATFFLLISSLAAICNAASARSARAVNKIGFSKRQNQWIGGAALYASACPSDLQSCGTTSAQAWCCPKGTVCRSDYCCPNSNSCDTVVNTFPSCSDPSWTLCSYDYYGSPAYFCCQSGEQCYMAIGSAPACGPANLPVQASQKLSTVSPSYTGTASAVAASAVASSISSPPASSSKLPSSISKSSFSSVVGSSSNSQVAPSITRSTGSTQPSGSSSATVAAGNAQTTPTSSDTPSAGTSSSGSSGLSSGAIAGIVIGVVIGLALIALVGILGARYGSKKAIENYTAAATANVASASPPVYNAPEGFPVYKPESTAEIGGVGYHGTSGDRVELGADGDRR